MIDAISLEIMERAYVYVQLACSVYVSQHIVYETSSSVIFKTYSVWLSPYFTSAQYLNSSSTQRPRKTDTATAAFHFVDAVGT